MTWTAGELVNELRHLSPDTEVYLLVGTGTDLHPIRRMRTSWPARARRVFRRHISGTRVVRLDDGSRFAYIEGWPQ